MNTVLGFSYLVNVNLNIPCSVFVFPNSYSTCCGAIENKVVETGSGQSAYLGQMGHFFSGLRGSMGQMKDNCMDYPVYIFKMVSMGSEHRHHQTVTLYNY